MLPIKAIVVCVDYDDFLAVTIPRMVKHVTELLVVTSPTDTRTVELVNKYPKARTYQTDAFYRRGAAFNKGWAMEEGFGQLGRDGWILILDADILLPEELPPLSLQIGNIYTPPRRILRDVDGLTAPPDIDVAKLPLRYEKGNFGYFQLFHADDPVVKNVRPWYQTDWVHAGGADSVFEKMWKPVNKKKLEFDVVHLGDPDQNWYGRVRPRIDTGERSAEAAARAEQLKKLHQKYGWAGQKKTGVPVSERLNDKTGAPEPGHAHGNMDRQQNSIRGLPFKRY